MPNKHAADNQKVIGIRARTDWIAQLDAAAKSAGESRMAYIRRAVEERMAREDHTPALQPGYHGESRGECPVSSVDEFLAVLDAKKSQVDAASPLPAATLQSLMDDFLIRYAHETTAIEGNTLTLHEAQVLLEDGTTVGGKSLREHVEVINVRSAWQALEAMVRDQVPLTETALGDLHRLLTQGILGDEAGSYRRVPVYIRGSLHVPPNWIKVPDLMQRFVDRFREQPPGDHPVRWAALAHIELAGIHPFVDGNGRVSRLVVNWLLMREGWPPALYTMTERQAYLASLEEAQYRRQPDRFVHVTAQAVQFMMDRSLEMIRQVEEGRQQTQDDDEAEWEPE